MRGCWVWGDTGNVAAVHLPHGFTVLLVLPRHAQSRHLPLAHLGGREEQVWLWQLTFELTFSYLQNRVANTFE